MMKKNFTTPHEPVLSNLFELEIDTGSIDRMNLRALESQIVEFNYDEKYIRFNINYVKHDTGIEIIPYDIISQLIGKNVALKLRILDKTNEVIFRIDFKAYFYEIKEFFNFDYIDTRPKYMKVYFRELE